MVKKLQGKKLISIVLVVTLIIGFMILSISTHAAKPFNVDIELSDKYKNVHPGDEVWFTILLLNLDNTERLDVTLNYNIVNSSSNEQIIHASKTVAIETQASFVASLRVPEDTPPGYYSVNVLVSSSLGESTAKASLQIVNPESNLIPYYYGAGIIGLIIIGLLLAKSRHLIDRIRLKIKIHRIVRQKLKNK